MACMYMTWCVMYVIWCVYHHVRYIIDVIWCVCMSHGVFVCHMVCDVCNMVCTWAPTLAPEHPSHPESTLHISHIRIHAYIYMYIHIHIFIYIHTHTHTVCERLACPRHTSEITCIDPVDFMRMCVCVCVCVRSKISHN